MPEFSLKKVHLVNYFLVALILFAALLLVRNIIDTSFLRKKFQLTAAGDKIARNIAHERKNIMYYATILEKNPFGFPMKFRLLPVTQNSADSKHDSLSDLISDLILVGTVTGPEKMSYAIFEVKSQSKPDRQEVFAYGKNIYNYGILSKIEPESVELKQDINIYTIPLVNIISHKKKKRISRADNAGSQQTSFVKKLGERQYLLDRRRVQQSLENPEHILTDARLLPNIQNGKQEGFKMYEVKPGGLYESLGLRNGDILLRVNGLEISNPEVAIQAMSALRGMNRVNLDIIRDGAKLSMTYQIR